MVKRKQSNYSSADSVEISSAQGELDRVNVENQLATNRAMMKLATTTGAIILLTAFVLGYSMIQGIRSSAISIARSAAEDEVERAFSKEAQRFVTYTRDASKFASESRAIVAAMEAKMERTYAGMPVGTIIPVVGSPVKGPEGWVLCDGRTLSKSDYPELFQSLSETNLTKSDGDSFRLPDLRNFFPNKEQSPGDEIEMLVYWFIKVR